MINNHLQPFTIIYNCSTNIVKQLQPNYNQLQPFNKQLQAIYNHLQLNYNWSTMDVEITTIYNTFSTIDLQRHPFTINLQWIIYNSLTIIDNHLQSVTMIYKPFTMIDNDLQPIYND